MQQSAHDSQEQEQLERVVNGEIVSDTDSDSNSEDTFEAETIRKKRIAIKRHVRRLKVKVIAERRLLRKIRKKTNQIIQTCPESAL